MHGGDVGFAAGRVGEEGLDRDPGFLRAAEFVFACGRQFAAETAHLAALGVVFVGGGEAPDGDGDVVGFAESGDVGGGDGEAGVGGADGDGEDLGDGRY